MARQRLVIMLEMAMMAALALLFSEVKVFTMPQGGSISLVMVPIALIGIRRGLLPGIVTGAVVGLLQLVFGSSFVHPVQLLLDYPLAFAALGLSGLVRLSENSSSSRRIVLLWISLLAGAAGRFVCHFVSGVVWFGEYAPEGTPVAVYSFLYNITYLIPEMIITGIVLSIIHSSAPQLLFPARNRLA